MKRTIACALAAILAAAPLAAAAGDRHMLVAPGGGGGRSAAPRVTMSDAMELAQRELGGRVLQAQSVNDGGREVYRIKVLTRRGEVRVVHVDAATGSIN